jgi:hypothetical protein
MNQNKDPVLTKISDVDSRIAVMQMDSEDATLFLVFCLGLGFILTICYMRALADEIIRKLGNSTSIKALPYNAPFKPEIKLEKNVVPERVHLATMIPVH